MTEIKAKVVLCDIEGTTTSISFVKDVLFPFAKSHVKDFLQNSWNELETQKIVEDLINLPQYKEFHAERKDSGDAATGPSIVLITEFVNYLIDKDLKLGPLKTLQGLIWEKGYTKGSIRGHIYADVPAAFKCWQEAGISIAIYSSGSVKAQQLLFGQTELGDLLPHISKHFDTAIGHKQEMESYVKIAEQLKVNAGDVLFLTDIVKEAEAARLAGMQTVVLMRPGNAPLTDHDMSTFEVISDFNSLQLSCS